MSLSLLESIVESMFASSPIILLTSDMVFSILRSRWLSDSNILLVVASITFSTFSERIFTSALTKSLDGWFSSCWMDGVSAGKSFKLLMLNAAVVGCGVYVL